MKRSNCSNLLLITVLIHLPMLCVSAESNTNNLKHSIMDFNQRNKKSLTIPNNIFILNFPRGGENSNYNNNHDMNQYTTHVTLGDLENNQIRQPQQNLQYAQSRSFSHRQKPKPIIQVIQEYFTRLHATSPILYYGTISSIIIFISWQIPNQSLSKILRNHFINSQYNLRRLRYHTLLTSILSHKSFKHLLMNMYGFHTFGTSIISTLSANGVPFSLYSLAAGILSNLFFLLLHPSGSSIGLSGVTISFFTLYAKLYPGKDISFFYHFIPIRVPAYYALIGLVVWSTFGTVMTLIGRGGDGVAHAVHLGGIMYGFFMYQLMKKGIWKNVIRKHWFVIRSKLSR